MIITIAFIAAIVAIIGMSMGLLDRSYNGVANKRFLVQSDVLLSNMLGILKSASSDVNDSTTLDIFLAMPLAFENSDFDTSATIAFTSAASCPNINWLIDKQAAKKDDPYTQIPLNPQMEAYLDRILSIYNVSDRILLVSMIADAIDEDLEARSSGSEIALDAPDFMQGEIYDLHHFNQIIDAYERISLDPMARRVPWAQLIGFTNMQLDFNHLTTEALSVLAPELEPEQAAMLTAERLDVYTALSELPLTQESKERLKKLHLAFYSAEVNGDIVIQNGDRKLHAAFLYNLGSKKVSDIEITQ